MFFWFFLGDKWAKNLSLPDFNSTRWLLRKQKLWLWGVYLITQQLCVCEEEEGGWSLTHATVYALLHYAQSFFLTRLEKSYQGEPTLSSEWGLLQETSSHFSEEHFFLNLRDNKPAHGSWAGAEGETGQHAQYSCSIQIIEGTRTGLVCHDDANTHVKCSLSETDSVGLRARSLRSCWFYELIVHLCAHVGVVVWWCGWLSPLNMSRLCQTRQSISTTSVSHLLLHVPPAPLHTHTITRSAPLSPPPPFCPSILISVLPSVSRSIFHFRFNLFDVCSLLRRHLFLPFCLPLSICRLRPPPSCFLTPPHSLVESICLSMGWRPANHRVTVSKMCFHLDLVFVCLLNGAFLNVCGRMHWK